jgi:hypothetical protein
MYNPDKVPRIDHIAVTNSVKRLFQNSAKGKPYSISAVAELTKTSRHTADRTLNELVGKDVNGKLEKTADNGHELFFRDPPACDLLVVAKAMAEKEGRKDLARGIGNLMAHFC